MKFSAERFRKNAEQAIRKRVPQSHLDVLDGMEVTGDTLEYQVDGEEYYLFPVYTEWCEEVSV